MPKQSSSTFIGPAKIANKIFDRIANSVIDAGGSDEDLRRVETDDDLVGKIGALIAGAKQAIKTIFKILIDYSLSLEQMVQLGHYNFVNPDIIAQNFLVKGSGQVERELELIHIGRNISTSGALAELDRQGYRPATIEELLALGAKHPELQCQFPVVALGSVWRNRDGEECVPYINEWGGGERDMYLCLVSRGWLDVCRFLGVRK